MLWPKGRFVLPSPHFFSSPSLFFSSPNSITPTHQVGAMATLVGPAVSRFLLSLSAEQQDSLATAMSATNDGARGALQRIVAIVTPWNIAKLAGLCVRLLLLAQRLLHSRNTMLVRSVEGLFRNIVKPALNLPLKLLMPANPDPAGAFVDSFLAEGQLARERQHAAFMHT